MNVYKKVLTSGSIFLIANIVAGFCNYLFQVVASKQLNATNFAAFNSWFAGLALFFMFGSLLQYAAVFFPMDNLRLKKWLILINILCIITVLIWLKLGDSSLVLKATLIIIGGSLSGWILGQIQNRLMFFTIAAGNIIIGISKLIIIFLFVFANQLESYRFAVFACYFPALWFITYQIWTSTATPHLIANENKKWAAPFILSVSGAFIPQMDMVLLAKLLNENDFSIFAKCSLFYKGIYFFIFIFAQWLLPHQVRGEGIFKGRSTYSIGIAGLAIFASGILAVISPWTVKVLLKWQVSPPITLIFLSCLNMSLLTWIFVLIQQACVQQKNKLAATLFLGLTCEALAQWFFHFETTGYLLFAIFAQSVLVLYYNVRTAK